MRGMRRLVVRMTGAMLSMVIVPAALAAPCGGFTDVDDTNPAAAPFCANVEWLKNRAVTLGCTSTTAYCPFDVVSRLAMAAFMNRLGTALTPIQVRVDTAPGAIDLDVGAVVCQTTDFVVTDVTRDLSSFPRRVYVDVSFNGNAVADVGLAADLVVSLDAGATWNALNTVVNRGSVPANQWGGLSDIGTTDLNVGQTARWGVRMSRGGVAGSADLADSRCQLRALVYNRNGTTSPF